MVAHTNGNVKKIRKERDKEMTITQKRFVILLVVMIVAFVLGRIAVRAIMNFMLGGTLFGGNFL